MSHFVNVSTLTLPAFLSYNIPSDMALELANRFDFDQIVSLSGTFELSAEKEYFVLKGNYAGEVVSHGQRIEVGETITLFLLTAKTQEALFDLTDDFEILDENQSFDLEEVLGQYLYLDVCDFE